jgi:hypothetical protein
VWERMPPVTQIGSAMGRGGQADRGRPAAGPQSMPLVDGDRCVRERGLRPGSVQADGSITTISAAFPNAGVCSASQSAIAAGAARETQAMSGLSREQSINDVNGGSDLFHSILSRYPTDLRRTPSRRRSIARW